MNKFYTPTEIKDLVDSVSDLKSGEAFIIISARKVETDDDDYVDISVAASPMSMEMMRAMITAAVTHHNIQEDSLDMVLSHRAGAFPDNA